MAPAPGTPEPYRSAHIRYARAMAHAHFFAGCSDEAVSWAKMALRELPDNHARIAYRCRKLCACWA